MQTITTAKWMIVLALSASLTAHAQDAARAKGPGSGANGTAGQHQRPSPEQMAKRLMEKFDANKDGELSLSELTLAVTDLEANRVHGPAQGGQHGTLQGATPATMPGAAAGVAGGQHQGPPPPPDKVAAHMIEKFSADKKGLTVGELTQAIEEHRANRALRAGAHAGATGSAGAAGN